jgi:hypothetical protein
MPLLFGAGLVERGEVTGPQIIGLAGRFWHWLGTPFRAIVALDFRQVRSLFSIAMLCGVVALSMENWALVALAHHSIESGEVVTVWMGLLLERLRYNSGLQFWFAFILGMVVFGADYFRAKWGEKEIGAGRGPDQSGERP